MTIIFLFFVQCALKSRWMWIALRLQSSVSSSGLPDILPVTMNMKTKERTWFFPPHTETNARWAPETEILSDNHLKMFICNSNVTFISRPIYLILVSALTPCPTKGGKETEDKLCLCVIPSTATALTTFFTENTFSQLLCDYNVSTYIYISIYNRALKAR